MGYDYSLMVAFPGMGIILLNYTLDTAIKSSDFAKPIPFARIYTIRNIYNIEYKISDTNCNISMPIFKIKHKTLSCTPVKINVILSRCSSDVVPPSTTLAQH